MDQTIVNECRVRYGSRKGCCGFVHKLIPLDELSIYIRLVRPASLVALT